MTPQEKAEEILYKFKNSECKDGYNDVRDIFASKRCALIAVDEIIDSFPFYPTAQDVGAKAQGLYENVVFSTNYWKEVKQEIENL